MALASSRGTGRVLISTIIESILEFLNQGVESLHPLVIRLQKVLHRLRLLFVQGESLEASVELLNTRVLKVSRVEVDGHVLDQKFGGIFLVLGELVENTLFFLFILALSLKTSGFHDLVKISDIICEG